MNPKPQDMPRDHIITDAPMRLRWGDWRTSQIIQVHVRTAAAYEDQRSETLAAGRGLPGHMPAHYNLDRGMRDTALGLLRHRHQPDEQKQVLYLAALMQTLLTAPCPILRTDLIRNVYAEVKRLSSRLCVSFSSRRAFFYLRSMKTPASLIFLPARWPASITCRSFTAPWKSWPKSGTRPWPKVM